MKKYSVLYQGLLARISSNTRTDSTSINYSFFAEIDWLKSLKDRVIPQPKQEWSEEDIVAIYCAVEVLSKDLPSLAASIERLKSLRPQNRWKPTKQQLLELRHVISGCSFEVTILIELEEQLKKLL